MAAPIRPAGVSAFGNEKWIFVPNANGIVDKDAPAIDEVTAVGALDVSGMLYVDGFDGPTADTSRVTSPRRIMDQTVLSALGTTTFNMGDLLYQVDPQAAPGADGKKAYETLDDNLAGYLVNVPGFDPETDVAEGDYVIVYPCKLGPKVITKTGTGEDGEFAVRQAVGITDTPSAIVALAGS